MAWIGSSAVLKKGISGATHCQDYVGYVVTGQGGLLCVADGLGSCSFAHIGARIAVKGFQETVSALCLCQTFEDYETVCRQTLDAVRKKIRSVAKKKKKDMREFSSTLLVVWIHARGTWGLRVGDSFAVARFGGQWKSLFVPKSGAAELTSSFLNEQAPYETFCQNDRPECVMCSSDGLYHLTYDIRSAQPHEAFFYDLESGMRKVRWRRQYLRKILRAAATIDPTDDKGVVVLLQR